MNVTFQRLLTRGDLPDSDGGAYNPSVWRDAKDGQLRMLVRREVNYLWDQPSYPTLVDPETKAHTTLIPVGYQGRQASVRVLAQIARQLPQDRGALSPRHCRGRLAL